MGTLLAFGLFIGLVAAAIGFVYFLYILAKGFEH